MDAESIAKIYAAQNGPEAGPWNLSLAGKYLEYRITRFFEENFTVKEGADICNVGIGAGYWDRYLSYRLRGGSLTSIDIDPEICGNFAACLNNEGNPNPVRIISRDVMECGELCGRFDIVTMIGSARMESGLFEDILRQVFSFLKPGGGLYYQSLDKDEDRMALEALCRECGLRTERYEQDIRYGYTAHYWKIVR